MIFEHFSLILNNFLCVLPFCAWRVEKVRRFSGLSLGAMLRTFGGSTVGG
jgi:hypothetical protein